MAKLCDAPGCYNSRWGKGFCKWHQNLRTDKKPKSIPFMAPKRADEYKIYRPRRDKYMSEHLICEVNGCNKPSNDLHHKNGKTGTMLSNVKYFMAICRPHHTDIDLKPDWARENNYLI